MGILNKILKIVGFLLLWAFCTFLSLIGLTLAVGGLMYGVEFLNTIYQGPMWPLVGLAAALGLAAATNIIGDKESTRREIEDEE